MIQAIQKSKTFKATCIFLALNIFFQIVFPSVALALSGGPAQPEFSGFTAIGTSDMVDLSSGDMNYNIPLMDVGGYPINISNSSATEMDAEASWVGLNWNLNVGQINRNVRGIPDDFNGDEMEYENFMRPNVTVGADFAVQPDLFGVSIIDVSGGISISYNNYNGYSIKPSIGVTADLGDVASVGFNIQTSEEGMTVSPNASIHQKKASSENKNRQMGLSAGCSMNSRQGLTTASLSMTNKCTSGLNGRNGENKNGENSSTGSVGSSIGFTNTSYTPSKRVGMNTEAFTFNAAIGGEVYGVEAQGQITAFMSIQSIWENEQKKTERAYGYENTHKANMSDVLDFNREKDGSLIKSSKNVALTNYTYDIYNVQGQGVSGMYRPYRNQVGYVFDPYVSDFSISTTLGAEFGIGNLAHGGTDFDVTTVNSYSSSWNNNNNIIGQLSASGSEPINTDFEMVHFKNVGDLGVDNEFEYDPIITPTNALFENTGSYQPIRIPFVGSKYFRTLQNTYLKKYQLDSNGNDNISANRLPVNAPIKRNHRKRRNQAINNISVGDLRKHIGYGPWALNPASIHPSAKNHHTGEIQVTRNDGARYIYGLPLYNTKKVEATFSVDGASAQRSVGLVSYSPINSPKNDLPHDQYYERITTPGYAHTYLLTSVLSTDYQDRTGNGPTPDDYGSYTAFEYGKPESSSPSVYRWRVPLEKNTASYNEGFNTDVKDDRGNYVYGEKEIKLIKSIKTKTHVAFFTCSKRKDAFGVKDENGGIDDSQASYKLDKISLYSITDYYKTDGTVNSYAVPIKEVHFEYSYSLCPGVLNNNNQAVVPNTNELSNAGGKLTLKKIYFTYRNSKMGKYTGYKFNYNEYVGGVDEFTEGSPTLAINPIENPSYNLKGYDSWGNYMPNTNLGASVATSAEFSFTSQDKPTQDKRAAVWNLKKISLPSGGTINLEYESDSYSNVQDKDAMRMYKIDGFGDGLSDAASNRFNTMYKNNAAHDAYEYMYIHVDGTAQVGTEDAAKYLHSVSQLYFRVFTNMTSQGGAGNTSDEALKQFDFVTGYLGSVSEATIVQDGTSKFLKVKLPITERGDHGTHEVNPISKAGWQFARMFLSKYAYSFSDDGDSQDVEAIVHRLIGAQMLDNLKEIFKGPNFTLEKKLIANTIVKDKSWVRLNTLNGEKLGGGLRVSKVRMSDVWSKMTTTDGINDNPHYQTMNYGQQYIYTKNGLSTGTTSGVASYEPVGNKENPFVQPVFTSNEHLLAPDEENYVEMPFGECFFPSPQITYAKVTVSNLQAGVGEAGMQVKKLHRTGSVISEFYTTKDFPTIVDQTIIQTKEDKDILGKMLKFSSKKGFTASQGYVVHLNDMNGKQKAQWVYAESQEGPISGVEYKYSTKATTDYNQGILDNIVPVIYPDGKVVPKKLGVEVDIVNDFRESSTETTTTGINANIATFLAAVIPGLVPMPLPDFSESKDIVRIASTTKVINTFGILKETIAYSDGVAVSTKNLAWDAMTGEVLVTETVDEFNSMYYTFNYPAHWYYRGMGQATANLGFKGQFDTPISSANGSDYLISGLADLRKILIEGDELVYGNGLQNGQRAWVSSFSATGSTCKLIDKNGAPITTPIGVFEVYRSGHRNLQSAGIMNITLMSNPIRNSSGGLQNITPSLFLTNPIDLKIINAGAVEYSNNWPAGCECGINDPNVQRNPYTSNELGVWRTIASRTFLTGRTFSADPTSKKDGFFSSFKPMYQINAQGTWSLQGVWGIHRSGWTFVSSVSKFSPYGFELENKDALNRFSAAQYGYNNKLPMAVGANTRYAEIGFDGFEDHAFEGCPFASHFKFDVPMEVTDPSLSNTISDKTSHTGRYSIKVGKNNKVVLTKKINCPSRVGALGVEFIDENQLLEELH